MNRFLRLLAILSLGYSDLVRSQVTENWTAIYSFNGYGNESWESVFSFEMDIQGNSYAFGATYDSINRSFLVKFDPAGNLQWASVEDYSSGRRMVIDSSGNPVCASWKTDLLSWDSTIVTKWNPDGNVEWEITYQGYDPTDMGIDHSGNIVILSDLNSAPGDPRILTKITSSGEILWSTSVSLGYSESFGPYCRIGNDNSIYVISEQFEVIKFDSGGVLLWENDLPGVLHSHRGYKASNAIAYDGRILLTGSTEIFNYQNHPDLVACMINSDGNVAWYDTVGGDLFTGLSAIPFENNVEVIGIDSTRTKLYYLRFDLSGELAAKILIEPNEFGLVPTDYKMDQNLNIYLAGYAKDTASVYSGMGLMKLDSSGNVMWNVFKSGSNEGNSYEHPFVSLDQNSNVMVAYTGNPDLWNFSIHDATIVKYLQQLGGISSVHVDESIQVFPNPSADKLAIELHDLGNENCMIHISDELGREVYRHEVPIGESRISISIEEWHSGPYIISLISESNIASMKWLKL